MKIFITGATGFIGSAVTKELLDAGHSLTALARSDKSAQSLEAQGIKVLRGGVKDLDVLKQGAQEADATVHLAFIHDWSAYLESCRIEDEAVKAMASVLIGTGKIFAVASASTMVAGQRPVTDETDLASKDSYNPRAVTDNFVTSLRSQNVRSVIIRFPPTVHGKGEEAFIPILINTAKGKGVSAYVGEGNNKWPAVHRNDAAALVARVVNDPKDALIVLPIAETGVPFKVIAEAIGKKLSLPVQSKTPEEAAEHFGFFVKFAGVDNVVDNTATRTKFDWVPKGPGLVEDIAENY